MRHLSRRHLLTALGVGLPLLGASACSGDSRAATPPSADPGSKRVVLAVVPGWDEGVAATYLWQQILQDQGYDAEVQALQVDQVFAALANGTVDVFLDAWLPTTHASYWQQYGSQLEELAQWSSPASNVIAVPEYVTGVDSLTDLAGHADTFSHQIIGIEPTSGLVRTTKTAVMPAYGLGEYQLVEGTSAAMLDALATATAAQQPIAVTLWQPHWAFAKFPLKVLSDPKAAFGQPDSLRAVATKGFSAKSPEVASWIRRFSLTPEDVAAIELRIQAQGVGRNAEADATRAWLKDNAAKVAPWTA